MILVVLKKFDYDLSNRFDVWLATFEVKLKIGQQLFEIGK